MHYRYRPGVLGLMLCLSQPVFALEAAVQEFIQQMVAKHQFIDTELAQIFGQVQTKTAILKAMDRPGESLPWHRYHPRFINQERIDGGVKFWRQHAASLQRAEQTYGVPASVIAAIIGVETVYGKNTGSYRVLDALSTLAFYYPRRAEFFRAELEHYLLLCRDERIAPLSLKGSYAGAMGLGQFMPSSYREYAVDFDGNGKRELFTVTDTIGSVANYLRSYGWETGRAVVLPAGVDSEANAAQLLELGIKPEHSIAQLKRQGLVWEGDDSLAQTPAALFMLELEDGPAYWLGLQNFYVITRYNRSSRYAMTVYMLAEQIQQTYYEGR